MAGPANSRADHLMLEEVSKNSKISLQGVQVTLAMVGAKVHTSTIRRRLHQFNLHERCVEKIPFAVKKKKNIRAILQFCY